MAPPKTSGTGKPAITKKEKAEKHGITERQYEERSKIGLEMKKSALNYISTHAKGVSSKEERTKIMKQAWKQARENAIAKHGVEKFKELNIDLKGSTGKTRVAAAKKKKTKSK
jgi:hypothetical protein